MVEPRTERTHLEAVSCPAVALSAAWLIAAGVVAGAEHRQRTVL